MTATEAPAVAPARSLSGDRPATPGEAPPPSPHEPRSRSRYILWLSGLVALLGLLYVATVRTVTFDGDAAIRFAPDAEAISLPGFDGGAHVAAYEHGGTVSFSFPLRNAGLLGVTVTGVRLDEDDPYPLVTIEHVTVDGDDLPARVGRGHTARVDVTARYDNCRYYHERELELLAGATVDASVLGMGITRDVSFDHPLVVRSPMIVDCPDRTLTRDDDPRR